MPYIFIPCLFSVSVAQVPVPNALCRVFTNPLAPVHSFSGLWRRRNGKPTSLGCFDREEEASRAYDKMMLWCEPVSCEVPVYRYF